MKFRPRRKNRNQTEINLTPMIDVSRARTATIPPRAIYEIGRRVFGPDDLLESCFAEDYHTNQPVTESGRIVSGSLFISSE